MNIETIAAGVLVVGYLAMMCLQLYFEFETYQKEKKDTKLKGVTE